MGVLFTLLFVLDDRNCLEWDNLGYFVHPSLLVVCQFYLFGKFVVTRITFCLSLPLRALWRANLWLCSSTRKCIYRLVILSGLDDDSIIRQYGAREMEDTWRLEFDVDDDALGAMVLHGNYLPTPVARVPTLKDPELVPVYGYYVQELDEWSEDEFFSEDGEEDEGIVHIYREEGKCEKKGQKMDNEKYGGEQQIFKEEVQEERRVVNHAGCTQQQQKQVQGYHKEKVKEEEAEEIGDHRRRNTEPRTQQHQQQKIIEDYYEKGVEEGEVIIDHIDGGQETETISQSAVNAAAEVDPIETISQSAVNAAAEVDPITDTDEFYLDYTRKMKMLEQLNQERLHALSTNLNTRVEDETFVFNAELLQRIKSLASDRYTFYPVPSEKYKLRKLISELELVYVGQACLSWKALQHQYHNVGRLAAFVPGAVFDCSVDKNFQLFTTLLERFVEMDKIDGKWLWNYIRQRSSFGNLLHVPEVSGYVEADGCQNQKTTTAEHLLTTIENSIKIFYDFLLANNNKPRGGLEKLFLLDSPVEDSNDIELFDRLRKEVHEKKCRLNKFDKVKKHWWRKRRVPFRDREKRNTLFSMIDLELASRVLKMFTISTKQLKWCEDRLNSVHLSDGRVSWKTTGSSFPLI